MGGRNSSHETSQLSFKTEWNFYAIGLPDLFLLFVKTKDLLGITMKPKLQSLFSLVHTCVVSMFVQMLGSRLQPHFKVTCGCWGVNGYIMRPGTPC